MIREDKRLPFFVEEKATFTISLGENATVEEVDGNTVPPSWSEAFEDLLKIQKKPTTAIVLGMVDSGKTSFCTYLVNRLLREKKKVAILDGDLGQSDIGPPCTIAYALVKKPITDLFSLEAKNAVFVGATSPSVAVNKVIDGIDSLKKEIQDDNPDFIVINTDGWIEGEEAADYKIELANKLRSDLIFYVQQKNELEYLSDALKEYKTVSVTSPTVIKQRSKEKRRSLRELGYIKYLKNTKMQSIPLNWIKIEENDLFGLSKTYMNTRQARKIYALLGMKPLRLVELTDKISIFIGRGRWVGEDSIKKIEEFTKKKVSVFRKGDEEGVLTALYNADRKFLGIGALQEIDYKRNILKIRAPLSKEICIIAFGKVKFDKNMKENLAFSEEKIATI